MTSASKDPARPSEELFAQWLAARGDAGATDFEAFVRDHSADESALRELHSRWEQMDRILRRAGFGGSLSQRLAERFGEALDPEVSLHGHAEQATPFTESVLSRLTGRSVAAGRYQIRGEIARGGMGVVLRVWDEDLRRQLAMKVILGRGDAPEGGDTPPVDSRQLARFLEEAQVTGQLDHPGIVPVHELGLDARGQVYFTMKLVKGQTLRDVFDLVRDEREGWTRTRALGVLLKVCEAMAYAHDKGVIHRDLKPGNVMVGKYGEVYVMDWGLARVLDQEDRKDVRIDPEPRTTSELLSERSASRAETPDSPLYTMDGDVVGTPAYMSPEQARGDLAAMGPHSDVYALGALLYHLLAGHMPFVPLGARLNNYAVWSAVQQGPPPPIQGLAPDAPAELVAICEKAMAREIGERYGDTSELARDLAAFLEGRVVAAYQTGAWAEAKKWVARNRPLAASLAAALVLLVAGLATSLTLRARAERNADLAADNAERADEKAELAAQNATRADEKAAEAIRLRQEAVVREEAATARSDALWAIEELKNFHTLDDDLEYARSQDRPTYVWWLEKAHELVDGRPADPARGLRKKPGLADHQRLLAEIRKSAREPTEAELAADRANHPKAQELEAKRAELNLISRMLGIELWPSETGVESREEGESVQRQMEELAERFPDGTAHSRRESLAAEVTTLEREVDGGRTFRFDDSEKEWWNTHLGRLREDLGELRARIALAERSVTAPEAVRQWAEAIAAIASSPEYGGLRLSPQLELLPLGPDPISGLWEFAHLGTGEPPVRGAGGRLELVPESGLVFVLLPSGRVPVEDGLEPTPLNEVFLDPFFLSKYEMTVAQWERTSADWTGSFWQDDDPLLPANTVSWDDCVASVERAGLFLRLPTEAQWEYGCRAGTTTPWWTGVSEDSLRGAANLVWDVDVTLQPIGGLLANPFGLHDVHGNVWEWCREEYGEESVAVRPGDGERLVASGSRGRVRRGGVFGLGASSARSGERRSGGFVFVASLVRSGKRDARSLEDRNFAHGLRVARSVTP